MSSSSSSPAKSSDGPNWSSLPVREIPGGYGPTFFGPIKDRYDYYYNQGQDEFFLSRIKKYKSTVYRTNVPPGPFVASNSKVVAVLDAVSFPILFDTSKVEKKDVFVGTFMPATSFTGGYRVCPYLDPSEPQHKLLKSFVLSLIANRHDKILPIFRRCMSDLFVNIETELTQKGKADLNTISDNMTFDFMFQLFCDREPKETSVGTKGREISSRWLGLQLLPLITLGYKFVPNFIEDLLLHTFPLPSFLVKSDYKKLYDSFHESAKSALDQAEGIGIKRDEACHNLIFFTGFNAFGGFKVSFLGLIKWVGLAGESLHRRLADEIRTVVKSEGGVVTLSALDKMSLTKSVVYEALRIEPPVTSQFGKAKVHLVVQSHDAAFEIKKGEMIFGYQPMATRDPKIFRNPDEFVADRFVGSDGEKLLKYVYWSNGRETDDPTVGNKQCPGKDFVVLLSRLLLVEYFLRYDTFTVEAGKLLLGSKVTIKSVTKATS